MQVFAFFSMRITRAEKHVLKIWGGDGHGTVMSLDPRSDVVKCSWLDDFARFPDFTFRFSATPSRRDGSPVPA